MYACVFVRMQVCKHACMDVCMHACMRAYMHVHVCTHRRLNTSDYSTILQLVVRVLLLMLIMNSCHANNSCNMLT